MNILRYKEERKEMRLEALRVNRSARSQTGAREPVPQEVQRAVWQRDCGRCVKCGNEERLHFDHIIPVSKGGSNSVQNVQVLCMKCNLRKAANVGG